MNQKTREEIVAVLERQGRKDLAEAVMFPYMAVMEHIHEAEKELKIALKESKKANHKRHIGIIEKLLKSFEVARNEMMYY